MLRLMLLILLIQANCMKIYCDEENLDGELRTTESATEISEKTLSDSASAESLQSPVETKETNKELSKDSAEFRVSRSSSNNAIEEETQVDESSKVHSAEASVTEKSAPVEVTVETSRHDDKEEVNKLKTESDFTEAHQDKTILVDDIEKQSEELPEKYSSVARNGDRKSMELLEASAESKITDYEKASSKVDETDRNFENEEIKERSIESGLDQSLPTRRMLSGPDYIVTVLDTKTKADTTPAELDLEVKIVPSQKFNNYDNFNEFGTQGSFKLTDSSQNELTTSPIPVRTITPVTSKVATPEILEQHYLPKYPQTELNTRFPSVTSDYQGPRDLPVYFKIKQDELQSQNQFIGAHNSPFIQTQPMEENTYFYPKIQHHNHQQHRTMDSGRISSNNQFQNLGIESRNQLPQFHNQFQNHLQMNVEFANRNQNSRNPVQQFHQKHELGRFDRKHFENINHNPRNEIQSLVNTYIPFNDKELRNEYPYYPYQTVMEYKNNLENKQIKSEPLAKPYPYLARPSRQENNLPNTYRELDRPTRTDSYIVPKKVKVLFQKLANASQFPIKMAPNLFSYNNNNMKRSAFFINPNIRANLYSQAPS